MKAKLKWMSFAVLIILLTGLLQPMSVLAESQTGSITINYQVNDVSFRLYEIGTLDSSGNYVLKEPYSSYHVDMSGDEAADNLAGYVNRDQADIQEVSRKSTENGTLTFDGLEAGVYLILGDVKTVDNVCYTPSPVIMSIPAQVGDKQVYNLTTDVKYSSTTSTDLVVLKTWKNDSESTRPESIIVQLTKNGTPVEEQVLSKSNNWTYEWHDLDPSYSWAVLEKTVKSGYTVSYDKQKAGVVSITNTASTSSSSSSSKIPQTGQLWWPVALLLIAGLLFLLIGILTRRNENFHEKK